MSRSSGFRIRSLPPPLNVPERGPSPTSPCLLRPQRSGPFHPVSARISPRTDAEGLAGPGQHPSPRRWRSCRPGKPVGTGGVGTGGLNLSHPRDTLPIAKHLHRPTLREPIGPAGPEGTYLRFAERRPPVTTAAGPGMAGRAPNPTVVVAGAGPCGDAGSRRFSRSDGHSWCSSGRFPVLPEIVFRVLLGCFRALPGSGPQRGGREKTAVASGSSCGAGHRRW